MGRKQLVRKAEPPSTRRIRWPRWTGFGNKTIWDLLQLLIVPLMLAALGFWFSTQQDMRQQKLENQRAQQAQELENQRAMADRKLAEQNAQNEALQAYLDQMSNLLLEKDLRKSKEDSEVRILARARTLTVLTRLDGERKPAVIQFLDEADLINVAPGKMPVVDLSLADLRGADLRGAYLDGTDLSNANLSEADLRGALLNGTDLNSANLSEADLRGANLWGADLGAAYLRGANLDQAVLIDTILGGAYLRGAEGLSKKQLGQAETLEGATIPKTLPKGHKVLP